MISVCIWKLDDKCMKSDTFICSQSTVPVGFVSSMTSLYDGRTRLELSGSLGVQYKSLQHNKRGSLVVQYKSLQHDKRGSLGVLQCLHLSGENYFSLVWHQRKLLHNSFLLVILKHLCSKSRWYQKKNRFPRISTVLRSTLSVFPLSAKRQSCVLRRLIRFLAPGEWGVDVALSLSLPPPLSISLSLALSLSLSLW